MQTPLIVKQSLQEVIDWIHPILQERVTPQTTMAELRKIVIGCEQDANSHGYTLKTNGHGISLDAMLYAREYLVQLQAYAQENQQGAV